MYQKTVNSPGNAARVLEKARDLLAVQGFEVAIMGGGQVRAINKSLVFTTRQPLSGVSHITVSASASSITLEADLSRTTRFSLLIGAGIILLDLLMIVVFYLTMGQTAIYIVLATAAPWVVLLPLMMLMFRKQAERSLDTMLNNLAAMG